MNKNAFKITILSLVITILCFNGYEINSATTLKTTQYDINKVVYNGKIFIAACQNGFILYSKDLTKWQAVKIKDGKNFNYIVWAGNKFVIMDDNNQCFKSIDGNEWSKLNLNIPEFKERGEYRPRLTSMIYDGKRFIFTTSMGVHPYFFSTEDFDKVTVFSKSDYDSVGFNAIATNGRMYVALGEFYPLDKIDGDNQIKYCDSSESPYEFGVATSNDGIAWNFVSGKRRDPFLGWWAPFTWKIIWDETQFVAVGFDCRVIASRDGLKWKEMGKTSAHFMQDYYDTPEMRGIAWNGKTYVAVGQGYVFKQGVFVTISTSGDLKKWKEKEFYKYKGGLNDIIWVNNKFIAAGLKNTIMISKDGEKWTKVTTIIADDPDADISIKPIN